MAGVSIFRRFEKWFGKRNISHSRELVVREPTPEDLAKERDDLARERARTVTKRIHERSRLAQTFIKKLETGYFQLKPIKRDSEEIPHSINLVSDNSREVQERLERMEVASTSYFNFDTDMFRFYVRKDKRLLGMLRRPFTHADLEEEEIEEKFPGDIRHRALMSSLNVIIERNQWRHIFVKRILQALFTFAFLFFIFLIDEALFVLSARYNLGDFDSPERSTAQFATEIAIASIAAFSFLIVGGMIFERIVRRETAIFRAETSNSCQRLGAYMTNVNADIRVNFGKLLQADIDNSQGQIPVVERSEWPLRVKRVFKAAMWECKRIEYLERFWKLQFERLRIFEVVSDFVGNCLSHLTALLVVACGSPIIFARVGEGTWMDYAEAWTTLTLFGAVGWYMGKLSRRPLFSFNVDDVRSQGFENWVHFGTIGYYERIAEQYRSAKGEIQRNILEGIFRGSPRP